jgi:hypothetical protein
LANDDARHFQARQKTSMVLFVDSNPGLLGELSGKLRVRSPGDERDNDLTGMLTDKPIPTRRRGLLFDFRGGGKDFKWGGKQRHLLYKRPTGRNIGVISDIPLARSPGSASSQRFAVALRTLRGYIRGHVR